MPRPKRIRRVNNPPHFKGFKPIGLSDGSIPIILNYEEYEAIRLSDFDLHGQVEAAKAMGVSRPTYARIYECARRKIAQAFIEGKAIVFEGGKVYFDSDWYSCNSCGCWFNHTEREQEVKCCALCGSKNIEPYNVDVEDKYDEACICPECGKEEPFSLEKACQQDVCPSCNCQMIRKGTSPLRRMKNKKCRSQ